MQRTYWVFHFFFFAAAAAINGGEDWLVMIDNGTCPVQITHLPTPRHPPTS